MKTARIALAIAIFTLLTGGVAAAVSKTHSHPATMGFAEAFDQAKIDVRNQCGFDVDRIVSSKDGWYVLQSARHDDNESTPDVRAAYARYGSTTIRDNALWSGVDNHGDENIPEGGTVWCPNQTIRDARWDGASLFYDNGIVFTPVDGPALGG